MWCDVVSCHLMWCDFLCCVLSRDAMWCHVMCSHVMSITCCEVMRCNGMRSHEFVMRCGWLRCHFVWFEVVILRGEVDELVIRTNYKVLQVLHSTTRYYKVLHSTTPVLLCTTKYYSSTTKYYKVLLQYYKVLLQYYSVLQSTTPVLPRPTPVLLCAAKYYSGTTKYYSSTTLYYKVLLQYYYLHCAEQQVSSSRVTEYCPCHVKWLSWLMPVAYETSFTMREATGVINQRHQVLPCREKWLASLIPMPYQTSFTISRATGLTLQPHQTLRLPRKMTHMIDPRHRWNAQSNRHHPPTSRNSAPATPNCTRKSKRNLPKTVEASFRVRGRFDHDPAMIRAWNCKTEPARSPSLLFSPGNAFCSANYNISRSGYLAKFHRILRLPRKVTLQHHQMLCVPPKVALQHHQILRLPRKVTQQHHQMLCLPRKMTRMIDLRHIWNLAEQQDSPSNVTNYCARHAILHSKI